MEHLAEPARFPLLSHYPWTTRGSVAALGAFVVGPRWSMIPAAMAILGGAIYLALDEDPHYLLESHAASLWPRFQVLSTAQCASETKVDWKHSKDGRLLLTWYAAAQALKTEASAGSPVFRFAQLCIVYFGGLIEDLSRTLTLPEAEAKCATVIETAPPQLETQLRFKLWSQV